MSYQREVRAEGSTLILGGIQYRIDSVEGMGGSSIVYRASYGDSLNKGERHFVLIKELFPISPRGDIRRGEDGEVLCTEEGEKSMDFYRLRFKQGNQANLELLAKKPSQTSGNLNSYEAYGTYYSVMTLHGGQNLEELLERGGLKLRQMADILIKILDALDCFHQNGFLHLDISPDNILLLKEGALLIDYNSIWNLNRSNEREFAISEKPGYSAPEVCLQNQEEIGIPSDIYSVCGIFFRMLAGRTLSEDEVVGNGLRKCFAEGFPVLEKEPKSASYKAMQILARGLHTLPRKRYQSAGEMRSDIEEMMDRIDHRGVSAATLWENSGLIYKKSTIRKEDFLSRRLSFEESGGESPDDDRYGSTDRLWEALLKGKSILLEGSGGMGKTTILGELWARGVRTWSKRAPIAIYIPLKERQTQEDSPDYIRRTMIRGIGFRDENERERDSLYELEKLLNQKPGEKPPIILLLDGLNEAGAPREKLLREIELLAAKPGVGVLVSDRTDEVQEYALKSFTTVRLLPLEKEVVEKELSRVGCVLESKESAGDLMKLLSNPMMLNLYVQIFAMEKESNKSVEPMKRIQSADELVGVFLEQLCLKQLRMDSGNQGLQLCHKYILHHLLPQIAWEMRKKNRTLLSFDEIYQITSESFRRLKDKNFGKSFPEYLGKARLMLAKTEDEAEWFDFAVVEQLVGKLGLLVRDEEGGYSLVHDNFQGYLSESYAQGGAVYDRLKKKKRALKITASFLLAVAVICGAGVLIYMARSSSSYDSGRTSITGTVYTEEEQDTINRAVVALQSNLGTLSSQIMAQRTVLEDAGKQELLNADEQAMEDLKELIAYQINYYDSYTILSLSEDLVEELIEINPDFPISEIQSLCGKPREMKAVMQQCLGELEDMLCDPDGIYMNYSDREEIVEVYENYLDVYTQYVYYEFNYILLYLDKDNVSEILNGNQYTKIFRDYYTKTGSIQQDVDIVKAAMKTAEDELKSAQNTMTEHHYTMFYYFLLP